MDKHKDIPNSWKQMALEDISKKITDGSHNPPKKIKSGIPMLSARNIHNNKIDFDSVRYISEFDYKNEDFLKLLISFI
ncbi:MAG: hypothetical protein HRT67_06145 [Flavobacteriaceae bacterium]|nr:hypothetical protein [Flavobacteriaceae bacterium]